MRVLVCGGRDYNDRARVDQALNDLRPRATTILQGGASGADMAARLWANEHANSEEYRADWRRFGNRAGPIRNQRMLDDGKPDLVIAFPGGRGTADMVRRAKAAGVEVREIPA